MSTTALLAPGTLVAGRYRIEEPLGGEASAALYRARDTRLERDVALRVLPLAEGRGGLAQQGRSAARLVHANVARVIDFGDDAEAGLHYVVADLGTGGTLAALLAQRGAPPLPLALRMLQEAAAGMAAAHHAGLVHGDLHPGAIWLSRDEGRLRAQVLGLGLDPSGGVPPRSTARYAAPERLRRAAALTAGADVFSLGAIGFEVLAGLPDDWTTRLLAMARGTAVVAPSPAEARPDLPPQVAQAVRRALAADPAARWPDAGELAAQLFAERAGGAAPAPAAPEPAATASPPKAAPLPRRPVAAATDLADTLYIPPAKENPAPAPVAAPAPSAPRPAPAAAVATPTPAPVTAPAPASVALVPAAAAAAPLAERRRRQGMERLGKGGGSRRTLIAAGIVLALLAGGGVVARTVLAGPGAPGADAGRVAASALAASPAAAVAEPEAQAGEPAPDAAAEAPPASATPPPPQAGEQRAPELERQRLEEQRRQQQRQDSLRAAQQAARQQLAVAQAPAAGPQQVAAAPPPVEASQPAPRIEQPVAPPAPAAAAPPAPSAPTAPAVDPNRVYGGGEVDQPPALSNRSAFQAAVQRSYPAAMRNSGTLGSAIVSLVVLEDGRVDRASVVVGEVSHAAFRPAAAAAIAQARFTPARLAGRPVRSQVSMQIIWRSEQE